MCLPSFIFYNIFHSTVSPLPAPCLLKSTTHSAWIHIMVSCLQSLAWALSSFLNVLGTPFLSLSSLKAKPPRCARLCASVIEYLCQTASNPIYSCVSGSLSQKDEAASWPFLSPTPHWAQYLVQSCTPTCAPYLASLPPKQLSKEAPVSHGVRPNVLVLVFSSPRPSLGPVCTSDRGKWSQIISE